jgi:hypothetical protein
MLLSPKVDVGMVPAATGEAATVVRVDRRLRLLPQEGIDVSCWADSGVLGWFLERMSLVTSHIRWRALQGFIVDENGTYQPGPMCQGADSEALSRSAATHGRESVPGLIGWIQTGSLNDLADCMITIKSRAMRSGEEPGGLSDAEKASLATALAAKYPTVEPSARLLFIAELSPAVHEPWLEPVDKLIHEETDKSVLPLALITRVKGPGDPLLDRAAASGVPDLVALAADLRARLAAGGSGFATAEKPAADKAK